MYFSRLTMPLLDRETQKRLADGYKMHQSVMGGFKAYDDKGRVLYRLEPETPGNRAVVVVQSRVLPDWNYLPGDVVSEIKEVDFSSILETGRIFSFRLRANPVVTRNGKRYGLIGEEAQRAWIEKKRCGVAFEDYRVIDEGHMVSIKNGRPVYYKAVRFEGRLRIVNSDEALKTLICGIGPAKGFGFGLLSLAKG